MRRFQLQDFQLPSLRQESQSDRLRPVDETRAGSTDGTHPRIHEVWLGRNQRLGISAKNHTRAALPVFCSLLTRAVAHCDSFLSTMLNSLSDCPCRQCMFNSRNTPLRYSTAPSCNVWTFEAFKEAEAFKRVAAESLSNDHRTMTWTAEKWCKHTESTESANGSGSSS